eukprot:SAG31_NODE_184_length_20985_cov_28.867567_3_plen_205_part_00
MRWEPYRYAWLYESWGPAQRRKHDHSIVAPLSVAALLSAGTVRRFQRSACPVRAAPSSRHSNRLHSNRRHVNTTILQTSQLRSVREQTLAHLGHARLCLCRLLLLFRLPSLGLGRAGSTHHHEEQAPLPAPAASSPPALLAMAAHTWTTTAERAGVGRFLGSPAAMDWQAGYVAAPAQEQEQEKGASLDRFQANLCKAYLQLMD